MDSENSKKHVLITLVGKSEPSPFSHPKVKEEKKRDTSRSVVRRKKGASAPILTFSDKLKLLFGEADLLAFVTEDMFECVEIDPVIKKAEQKNNVEANAEEFIESSFENEKGQVTVKRIWNHLEEYPDVKDIAPTYYTSENVSNILAFCEEKKPDIVFMFPTGVRCFKNGKCEQTITNAQHVKDLLHEGSHEGVKCECEILPLDITSVKGVKEIYVEIRKQFKKMLELLNSSYGGVENCYFSVITSIAAPDMRTALNEYISTTENTYSNYSVLLPEDAKNGKRVEKIPNDIESVADMIKSLDDDIENYRFDVIAKNMETISDISALEGRKDIAKIFIDIFNAYSDMERVNYCAAHQKISKALAELNNIFKEEKKPYGNDEAVKEMIKVLEDQEKFLDELKANDKKESVKNLVDLYFNIQRSAKRQNHADVLSRFWRLREGIMYFIINKRGLDARRFVDKNNSVIQDIITYNSNENQNVIKLNEDKYNRLKMKLDTNIKNLVLTLTKALKDNNLCKFEEYYGTEENNDLNITLQTFKDKRNDTIVAHGMKPVDPQGTDYCCHIAKDMIVKFKLLGDNGPQLLEEYPFQPAHFLKLSKMLKSL